MHLSVPYFTWDDAQNERPNAKCVSVEKIFPLAWRRE
jgi:hypothetical protein